MAGRAQVKSSLIASAVVLFVSWLFYGSPCVACRPGEPNLHAIEKFFGCRTTLSEFLSDSVEIKAIPIFIPEIRQGIEDVRYHNAVSRLSYLLGEVRSDGWTYSIISLCSASARRC